MTSTRAQLGEKAMTGNIGSGGGRQESRWRTAVWSTAALVLLLPALAMQFTEKVDWDLADFVIFGAMLVGACGTYELASRLTRNSAYRAAVGVALVAAFILVWMSLAVGIIGTEDDLVNLMFGGVLFVGITGAIIARFQPRGMVRALVAMAIAQALIAVIALITGLGNIWVLTSFFVALWLTSAWLFRKAEREHNRLAA